MFSKENLTHATCAPKRFGQAVFVVLLAIGISSCGGSSSSGGGGGTNPTGTAMTVTFGGGSVPLAVATQIGTNAWATATAGSSLTFTLPQGTTTYGLAYVCPTIQGMGPINEENVIYATAQDGTAYTVNCPPVVSSTVSQAGSVDASIIPGTAGIEIIGLYGYGTTVSGVSGSFNATMASATQDVAFIALDSTNHTLAVHIVPSQTIPGVINNGNTVVFLTSDAVTLQPLTVTGVPAGFNATPASGASYFTAHGTYINLFSASAGQYPAISSANAQTGDYYFLSANDADGATFQGDYTSMTAATAGPVTLTLPAPLTYSAPTPAALPSFNVAYSGFSGLTAISDSVSIQWFNPSTTDNFLTVTATSAYQNGATTLAVPDLSSLSGFFPKAASGTTVYWDEQVDGGTYPAFTSTPTSGTLAFPFNRNTFVVP